MLNDHLFYSVKVCRRKDSNFDIIRLVGPFLTGQSLPYLLKESMIYESNIVYLHSSQIRKVLHVYLKARRIVVSLYRTVFTLPSLILG